MENACLERQLVQLLANIRQIKEFWSSLSATPHHQALYSDLWYDIQLAKEGYDPNDMPSPLDFSTFIIKFTFTSFFP